MLERGLTCALSSSLGRCGHCKQLAPKYVEAAKKAKELDHPVPLAKVDATDPACSELTNRFGIDAYPQLKLFIDGQRLDYAYGLDVDSIVDHLKRHSSFGLPKMHTPTELEVMVTSSKKPFVLGLFRMPITASKAYQAFRSTAFALAGQDVAFAFAASSQGDPPVMPLTSDGKKPPVPGLVLVDAKGKLATRSLAVPRRKEDFTDSYIETWLRSVGVDVILPDPPESEEPVSSLDAEEDGRLAHEHRLAQDMEEDERGETEWDDYNDDPDSLIPD